MENTVKENDLVLAENGPEVILATYDKNFPLNTTTFDYFLYRNGQDLASYGKAVNDGYFNLIQLKNNEGDVAERERSISSQIKEVINKNYKLSYSDEDFSVYKRIY